MRVLALRQERGAVARPGQPASEEVPCRAHGSGRALGWREHAPAQEDGDFLGVHRVVFGLAPVAGVHREGGAKHEGEALAGPQGRAPVPGQAPRDSDDEFVPRGGKRLEQGLRAGFHGAVPQDLPGLGQEAERHGAGMQIDATGRLVLLGGASPAVSASSW
jgi:hypothetical protein